ncbi:hypothetical protein AB1Y20_007825 [Prymnesium parvum]|uniref:DSBA-like thioredoxin domain-containing protein n=1 Tax=Prymnesium parvum TaxID=97485 RepID=A0AB34IUU1_PRYPA|mmetsp:Transcript_3363/g.8392  ORF Transcript_3363/g.8392 Transcript_3363/m.8392 type:complete len:193 (-) Transcript_3363:292-870(-)
MAQARETLGLTFEVKWRPFFLDPSLPTEGKSKLEHYNAKFGVERVKQMAPFMKQTFESEGIPDYSMDGLLGNTFDSHRLIELAGEQSEAKQDALVEQLFRAYFTQGKSLSDREVLVAAAGRAEVDGARELLESSAKREEVLAGVEEAYRAGVTGVPHFRIRSSSGVVRELSGGQPPEEFLKIFSSFARRGGN